MRRKPETRFSDFKTPGGASTYKILLSSVPLRLRRGETAALAGGWEQVKNKAGNYGQRSLTTTQIALFQDPLKLLHFKVFSFLL